MISKTLKSLNSFALFTLVLTFFILAFSPYISIADNVVFPKRGSLSERLYDNKKYISLTKKIIECESGKFIYNKEIIKKINEKSYHHIIGKVGDSCLYNSNYYCGSDKCFSSCEFSLETITSLKERLLHHESLLNKNLPTKEDILNITDLDIKLFESFKRECKTKVRN